VDAFGRESAATRQRSQRGEYALYLPVQVEGALAYVGDPHFAQGDGEVALTAM